MSIVHRPILLIEDNPMDADLTCRAFSRRKLVNPVEVARDGEEAVRLVESWQPGTPLPIMILLDLNLPKISGLEVLKELKAHREFRRIPVVVLTTSTEDRDIETAYDLGANSYIVKPVNFEKFVEVAAQLEIYWGMLNHPCPAPVRNPDPAA